MSTTPNIQFERGLPAAIDAERSILGAVLLDNQHYDEAAQRISGADFSLDPHRRIFSRMADLVSERRAVDIITLRDALSQHREMESIGGVAYLASLTENLPRRLSIEEYVRIVREKSDLRRIIAMSSEAIGAASDARSSIEIVSTVQDAIEDILEGSQGHDNPLVSSYLLPVLDALERARSAPREAGIGFGLDSLDAFTGGMRAGEVIVVGARSGVGKSSLMIQSAVANCRLGIPVHLFSLEMTREQVIHRILAILSGVPFKLVDNPHLASEDDMRRVREAGNELAEWPLRIHDKSEMHIDQIVGLARLSIRRNGTRLVVVDYAQNVKADGRDERTRVSDTSRSLTRMIKHEPASLMLLSQLRKVDREHYSKPPVIADLRETGQLENDAHLVLLLHRGWDEEQARIAEESEILVPKQRRGETGVIRARFSRRSVTFE